MIIGLTGENCAGKSTAAEYLNRKSFYFVSLSDIIREELKSEGKEVTRKNLIDKGNELRKNHGSGILAKKTIERMDYGKNYVVDSIRNPEEVKELKNTNKFFLFYITASPEKRFQRIKSRGRESDPQTYGAFLEIEKLELENEDPSMQNLKNTFSMAEKKIKNDGDMALFHENVHRALSEVNENFVEERPSWDEYFMRIAEVVASRSNCIKRKVAAVIVRDKRIISTGYNGTPRGTTNCNEGGCPRCNSFADSGTSLEQCYCSHGEENAIVQAAYHGVSIKGATIYTTFSPCINCTKMIINSGITEVVYNSEYPLGEGALSLLKEAGVNVRKLKRKR